MSDTPLEGVDRAGTTSVSLLTRAQAGDATAREELFTRFRSRLIRWMSGRLPSQHRALCDTDDLVQDTLIKTLRSLEGLVIRTDADLAAYLRQAIWNRLKQEIRNTGRRRTEDMEENFTSADPSPLERAIGAEAIERYELALQKLDAEERSAIVGRFELGYSYEELAVMLEKRTPDAARKIVNRAIPRLVDRMVDGL